MKEKENSRFHWSKQYKGRTWILRLIAVVLILYLFIGMGRVPSASMDPTLEVRDLVLYQKHVQSFEVGDVIRFQVNGEQMVKRVAATPGDLVATDGVSIWINGEDYTGVSVEPTLSNPLSEIKLQPNEYYVIGDNHGNSIDSRVYGPVLAENVLGKAFWKLMPPGKIKDRENS